MTDDKNKNRLTKIQQENPGFITSMARTLKLVFRLLVDRRVNFFLKLLPIGALVYLVSPLDAAIPAVDDALVVGIGTYVFVELCPPEIVEEHRARLAGLEENDQTSHNQSEVVDTLFKKDKDQ